MALTRVFWEFGAPLEGETFKKMLYTNTYDDRSFHHMGCRKIEGCLVHQASIQELDLELDWELASTKARPSKPPIEIAPIELEATPQPSEPVTPLAPIAPNIAPRTLTAP